MNVNQLSSYLCWYWYFS